MHPRRAQGAPRLSPELERILELAKVSPRTLRNWSSGATRTPGAVLALVALVSCGELEPLAGPAWAGWRIERGELVSAEGYRFNPDELTRLAWLQHSFAARELERAGGPVQHELPGF